MGERITVVLPDERVVCAVVTVVHPLIGARIYVEGFGWKVNGLSVYDSYSRFDREGADWICGWHRHGSEELGAFLAVRKLTLSQGDRP